MKQTIWEICPTCLKTVEMDKDRVVGSYVIYVHHRDGGERTFRKDILKRKHNEAEAQEDAQEDSFEDAGL